MSATDTLPPLVPLSQKPTRIIKARPPNRPPPHLPPKPPQKPPPPAPKNHPPFAKSDVGGPRSDVTGPRSDVGGPRSDVGGPRSDVGGPRSDVTGHRSDVGGPRSDVMGPRSGLRSDLGPRSDVGGPRSDVGGPRSDVGGPRSDVGGPRSDVGGPRSDAMGGLRSDLGPRSDVGGPRTDLSNPKNHSVIPAARSDVESPDNVVDNRLLPGVCVKKMAGLFQKEPVGGASDDPQPVGPPKPTVGPSREEKVLPQMEENTMQVAAELMEEEETCPPPLPPKNVQDPDVRATKMGSCPPLPACPARCRCACHLQRPGMVLVWLPESFILRSRNLSEASDSSDDGGVIHRTLPASEGAEDRGKWGPWSLKNKMVSGGTYSRRRRSLRSSEYLMEGPRVMEAKPGVVLTSYKSTNDSSFEGGSDSSPPDSASKLNGEATESELRSLSTNSAEQSETSHTDSAPPLPQSEAPPLRSHRFRAEFSGESLELLPQCSNPPAPEDLDSDPSALRDSTEDVSAAESRAKVRKPARRSKVPPLALLPVEEKTALVPPKVPSKPPRWAAPPPPPFVRKGSLKRYSAGNSEEVEQREEESSSTLATMYLPSENCPSEGQESCGADTADCAHEIYRGGSIFMSPPVRSPKSIDWESHLRDEPLYQTYRQAVIKKELRRQTVPRNSSFTSYDSSHDSPLSSGGSPKQGRRSAASHNTLWQELPAVKESGVLGDMSNEEKKMQESMFEVLTSEASYLRSLNVLIEHFMESRELDDTLIVREKKILFSNVLKVKEVSERFLMDLEDRVEENIIITDVCDIIYQHALHHFPVYIDYVRNQVFQEKTYSELLEKNPQFHATLCRLQELPQCQRLPFMSFLLLPFQRITRIKMLIENILKRTEEGSEMEQNATNALDCVSKIIQECNREVGRMKQTEELIHIAQKIVFDKIKAVPIISQNRFLEKQGELSEMLQKGSLFGIKPTKFTPVYFFLFNDFLLITQKKSSDKYVVLDHAHRSLVQAQTCPTVENSFFLTFLENHQGKMCERLFKASTQSDLHRWVAAFPNLKDDSLMGSDTIYEDWDCPQVQCIEPYTASQTDELYLETLDIINVLKKTSEGWYEGIRLSDGKKGWFPSLYVQEITNEHVRRRNLRERHRVLQAARQIQINRFVEPRKKTGSA